PLVELVRAEIESISDELHDVFRNRRNHITGSHDQHSQSGGLWSSNRELYGNVQSAAHSIKKPFSTTGGKLDIKVFHPSSPIAGRSVPDVKIQSVGMPVLAETQVAELTRQTSGLVFLNTRSVLIVHRPNRGPLLEVLSKMIDLQNGKYFVTNAQGDRGATT